MPSRSDTPPATRRSTSVARARRAEERDVRRRRRRGTGRTGGRRGRPARRRAPRASAGGAAPPPGERGEPLRPRVEPDRQPVAGDLEAVGAGAAGRRRSPSPGTTRVAPGREREPDRVGRLEAAGELDRDRDARRDRADGLEVRRACRAARRRSRRGGSAARRARRTARRSGRAGPSGAPTPAATPGQNTTRERPRSRSIDGMTCTSGAALDGAAARRAARADAAGARRPAAIVSRSSRRWKLIGSDPLRAACRGSRAGRSAARGGAARRRGAGAAAPCRAGTTAGRSACRCSAGPRPGRSAPSKLVCSTRNSDRLVDAQISPRCIRTSRMIRQARQIASVYMFEPEVRGVVEALLAHHLLGVHPPALDELRARRSASRVSDGWRFATASWRWWPGYASWMLVLLIELKLCSRIAFGIVADRRRDDVDALRRRVELRRREVGRERDDVAEVLGRRDDVDPLVRRDGRRCRGR